MKLAIILMFAYVWQNQNVHCFDVISVLARKLGQFRSAVSSAFGRFMDKLTLPFTMPRYNYMPEIPIDQEVNLKHSFQEFVERTAADTDADDDYKEYFNMKSEPTALMSTPQLATLHGRRIESHIVKAKDGYLLTLHRITNNNSTSNVRNQTVLLSHGLLGSSADWIMLGPEISLPYILSDAGYDVWMVNARGNYYSRGHVITPVKSPQFWKFSWQEMGEYDLPAIIDYISVIGNSSTGINYVGHSMGATALMVLLSTRPRYNQNIRIGILMAPLVFMNNIQGPLKMLTPMATNPPEHLLKTIGNTEFLPSRKIPKLISKKFCFARKFYCSNPLLFFAGALHDDGRLNASFLARLLYHVPAGGSTNTMMHYGQLVKSGKFHRFNKENKEFPLHKVIAPIVMFSSSDDWLAPIADVLRLYFSISNPLDHYVIRDKNISHTEFVWGVEADTWVFPRIIDYIENGLNPENIKSNEV